MRLKGKVAIVTGGGAGIGGAAARAMAAEGASLCIAELDPAIAEKAVTAITSAGGTAWAKAFDATSAAEINCFVAEVASRHGRIDILVNTVGGIYARGSVAEVSEDDWDETFRRNVKSTFHANRAVLPHMQKQRAGSIVNMGSAAGLAARKRLSAYSAAKGAIIALTRQMAIDYGPEGIRVNAICPGPVLTERSAQRYDREPALKARRAKEQLLGRTGEPRDVAGMIVFLASDEASWITGHAFPVDGGSTAGQGLER